MNTARSRRTARVRQSTPPRRPPRRPRGAALHIAAGMIAAGAVVWAGIASVASPSGVLKAHRAKFRGPAPAIEIEASLGELGLTPRILASAGFTAQQTSSFATAAATYMRAHMPDYRAAQDSASEARKEVNRLLRLIQGGASTPEDRTALATAQTSLTTAIAQRQAILDAGLAAGAAEVPAQAAALLDTFRTNQRAWWLSEQYLGDARSERDWVALRDALANDRISARDGVDPDPASHQLLLDAQATPNARNAIANLPNLPDIQTAWSQAMGP